MPKKIAAVLNRRRYDVEVVDRQTLEWECRCGVTLTLPHLQDQDTYETWYGGICGNCGDEHHIETDDALLCRDCDTPLAFVSDNPFDEQMYCPKCDPDGER